MLGAIVGDVIGSVYEHHNIKTKEFPLFSLDCCPTDDSVFTLAIAKAVLQSRPDHSDLADNAVKWMQRLGRIYPDAGYGRKAWRWIRSPKPKPYNSYGNGSAMRVSPVAYAAGSLEDAEELAVLVTEITHDHPEGIKGAKAVAGAVYLALHGADKAAIRAYIRQYYALDFTIDAIRDSYDFQVSCQESVPQALEAFLESESFEDAIRTAISLGGDSDTIAAITGSVAGPFYGIPEDIAEQTRRCLDERQCWLLDEFCQRYL